MAEKTSKNPLGPTGELVRANVKRLRTARGLTYRQLSDRLQELGRPIPTLGLSRIENGERRVDADDLMALAVALRVNPSALLLPHTIEGEVELTAAGVVPADIAWRWADGEGPIGPLAEGERYSTELLEFLLHARPPGRRDLAVD